MCLHPRQNTWHLMYFIAGWLHIDLQLLPYRNTKLVRNLTVAEICGQVLLAMDELDDWPSGKPERRLTNIVLMGMGEPLFNYDNVSKAVQIIMSGEGVAISK